MSTNQCSGIYAIVNRLNGKRYVGSSCYISKRCYEHKRKLKLGTHENQHLQRAWNKCGADSFDFIVLEYVHPEFLLGIEQKYIDKNKRGYNLSRWADAPTTGRHLSPETCAKISAAHKGKKMSAEWKEKQKLRVVSDATRAKLSAAHKMRIVLPETRAKLSALAKQRGLTPEHLEKLSWKGRKHSVESIAKMSAARKGVKHSIETKAKMSAARKGKKFGPPSKEHRANLSAARKRMFALRKLALTDNIPPL